MKVRTEVLSNNQHLIRWVEKIAALTTPDAIHWVDGSKEEYDWLCDQMIQSGTFTKLNQQLWPGCFYAKSDPGDVARVEDRTFVCSLSKDNCRAHEQLGKSLRNAQEAEEPVHRLDERPDHVRPSFQHGADRLAFLANRRGTHGLALCRGEHAYHGSHRIECLSRNRQSVRARGPLCPFRRCAACSGPERCALALQQREIHRPFSRDSRNLVLRFRLRWERAAGEKMFCAANRIEHRPRRRVGWPSTC